MRLPNYLKNTWNTLEVLETKSIVKAIRDIVENGMTRDMLVGNVTSKLMYRDEIQAINDGSYNFKKVLMIKVKLVVDAMPFKWQTTTTTEFTKDGSMYLVEHITIIEQKDPVDPFKQWFKEVDVFQDYLVVKGSNKVLDNNSTELLEEKADKEYRVKEISPLYINLYAVLLYESTRSKVEDKNYAKRLMEVASATKEYMGYTYINDRKLDSNGRNYPLSRFGFANEYGDAFEKFLIEPAKGYEVTADDIHYATEYLKEEFGREDTQALIEEARRVAAINITLLPKYNKGENVKFTITHKELGKYLHIIDVGNNIINNLGGFTTALISSDFTNSGGIMAANQFGDEKFLKTVNLLGGEEVFDTHQRVADYLGISREEAKPIMQGPNHGGRIPEEFTDMVEEIFGPNYKYIRKIAEYGIELAKAGHTNITLTRPDGVKVYWSPYLLNCSVPMEDGTTVSAVMPFNENADAGEFKAVGFAVSCLHSCDAFVEHYVDSKLMEKGHHIKSTLDNFYHRPSLKPLIIDLAFEALEILEGWVESQLEEVEIKTGIQRGWKLPQRPNIVKSGNIF